MESRSGPQRPRSEPVSHIGTYRRSLPVSIERLYENAVDWEHLPYVHRSTFSRIECLEAGQWGFRARVWRRAREDGQAFLLDLRLDHDCRRWITRTVEGPGRGGEVWTHAFAIDADRTDIVVDFFAPGQPPEQAPALLRFYTDLYTRLYDEDVAMMALRQQRLGEDRGEPIDTSNAPHRLGTLAEVRARLPLVVELAGRRLRVVEVGGKLFAHTVICPHLLGPLENAEVRAGGTIECPWHGYRFDLESGVCVSHENLRLPPAGAVWVDPVTALVTVTQR